MRNGKVKIKDIWAKEDDDIVALGFLNYRLNEVLTPLGEAISEKFDKIDPYLVLTSGAGQTSIQAPTCTSLGLYSIALGRDATASAHYTAAIGKNVTASSVYSIAMGVNSQATNEAAFAAGVNAIASGAHSRAFGTNVNAGYVYQTVIGKDNLNKEGTLFEIGGGNGVEGDEKEKWNVFEVYNDGTAKLGGKTVATLEDIPQGGGGTKLYYHSFTETEETYSYVGFISSNPNKYTAETFKSFISTISAIGLPASGSLMSDDVRIVSVCRGNTDDNIIVFTAKGDAVFVKTANITFREPVEL